MKAWAAVGILVAAAILGAIACVAVSSFVYANGININLKLVAIIGVSAVIAGLLGLTWWRKQAS